MLDEQIHYETKMKSIYQLQMGCHERHHKAGAHRMPKKWVDKIDGKRKCKNQNFR
jgi:hypothetical protein